MPIVTMSFSLASPETTVGSQLLHPRGCFASSASVIVGATSLTGSATGRGLATTYAAKARTVPSLRNAMLMMLAWTPLLLDIDDRLLLPPSRAQGSASNPRRIKPGFIFQLFTRLKLPGASPGLLDNLLHDVEEHQ